MATPSQIRNNASDAQETQEFLERMTSRDRDEGRRVPGPGIELQCNPPSSGEKNPILQGDLCQWLVLGNGKFLGASNTIKSLVPGTYTVDMCDMGPVFVKLQIVTDDLLRFPDSRSEAVLSGIRKFWAAKDRFRKHGQIHKRGVLLWGPPGSGKTVTTMQLTGDLIAAGGMVLMCSHPSVMISALRVLRRVEPDRPLICIMEDLDELVQNYGESGFLNLLDGENQVDNVCFVATSNYPERLDPRFVNRPSRFDEIIKIGMPTDEARRFYLERKAGQDLLPEEINRWVADTEDMSLAHLKELVVSVFCLDVPYDSVIARLRVMKKMAFEEKRFGIAAQFGAAGGKVARFNGPAEVSRR